LDYKKIFFKLLKAETEEEVFQIIKDEGLDQPQYWQPYGDNDSNFSVIGGQSSSAEKALIEKITNAVDALLTRKCLELGIDPKGPAAPQTSQAALETFYGIKDGKYSNVTKDQEDKICEDLYLIATSKDMKIVSQQGKNKHINISIYDGGEGQTPKNLPNTILSLLRGNKKGIPFTQGRYNQGGSGAMLYCGQKGYSLIISKRHPSIINETDMKDRGVDEWGWTLTRMEMRPVEEEPVFTYFAPNREVPSFESDSLPLKPQVLKGREAKEYLDYDKSCSAGIPYKEDVDYGTLIKLYNYNLKQKGPLISHFKYELGRCILDTYLPIRVVDCRMNKFNNDTIFRGLVKVIEDDNKSSNPLVNEKFPITHTFEVKNQQVKLTVYGFNNKGSSKKNVRSIIGKSKPIAFTLGQQFQDGLSKAYISNSGLGILKDWLLIIVEFPNIDRYFKKDLFMTDRERIADKWPKEGITKQLKAFLKENETLREFASEKMEELLNEDVNEDSDIKSAVENWIEKNPEIQNALVFGNWLQGGNSGEDGEGGRRRRKKKKNKTKQATVKTNFIPTFFKPMLRTAGNEYVTNVSKDRYMTIRFKTDAPEDFFDRQSNIGKMNVLFNNKVTNKFGCTINRGVANIHCRKDLSKKIGQHNMKIRITCDGTNMDYNFDITVNVNKPTNNGEKNKKGKLGLPNYKEIYQNKWEDHDMNERTGALFERAKNKEVYLLNMDNIHLQGILENCKDKGEEEYYKNLYRACMLLNGMAAKNEAEQLMDENVENQKTIEEVVANATENVARTLYVMDRLITDMRKKIA